MANKAWKVGEDYDLPGGRLRTDRRTDVRLKHIFCRRRLYRTGDGESNRERQIEIEGWGSGERERRREKRWKRQTDS